MTQQHTPGPWRIGDAGNTIFGPKMVDGSLAVMVASISRPGRDLDAKHANARLIAAAPELLAELQRLYEAARTMADPEHCLHATREYLPWCALADKARAAIAKAEGRAE